MVLKRTSLNFPLPNPTSTYFIQISTFIKKYIPFFQ